MSPTDLSPDAILRQLEQLVTNVAHQLITHFHIHPPSQSSTRTPRQRLNLLKTQQTPLAALRLAYLASLSHLHIRQNRLLTKRDVYYMCRPLFPNTFVVDRTLEALSKLLHIPRNDLCIVAAPKGLVSGTIAYVDEAHDFVSVTMFGPDGCIIPSRPERISQVSTDACAILVYVRINMYICSPNPAFRH